MIKNEWPEGRCYDYGQYTNPDATEYAIHKTQLSKENGGHDMKIVRRNQLRSTCVRILYASLHHMCEVFVHICFSSKLQSACTDLIGSHTL